MGTAKHCLVILALLMVPAYEALSYDYTWDDYRTPFMQLVLVPVYTSGTSTVYLELPETLINTSERLTLNIDIESNLLLKTDGLEQRGFNYWAAYCSVNGAGLFGKHKLPVNAFPARQTCSIVIATKDLKAGRNTLEFSMSPSGGPVTWSGIYGKGIPAYGIHRMWFGELSSPSQERISEKGKDASIGKSKPVEPITKSEGLDIETKLMKLKQLLEEGLINREDYNRKKAELLDQVTLALPPGAKVPVEERKVAAIPPESKPGVIERIKLRDRAEKNFSNQDLQNMIKERNFFNRQFNPGGSFPNSFVDNGDGTAADKVTGLMWQKGGSPSEMPYHAVGKYLDDLNSSRFGGYGDWRLPTMEELCSLLKGTPSNSGRFLDNLFDPIQEICWSADENQRYYGLRPVPVKAAFCVSFSMGEISAGNAEDFQISNQDRHYVRAVRTAE